MHRQWNYTVQITSNMKKERRKHGNTATYPQNCSNFGSNDNTRKIDAELEMINSPVHIGSSFLNLLEFVNGKEFFSPCILIQVKIMHPKWVYVNELWLIDCYAKWIIEMACEINTAQMAATNDIYWLFFDNN